MSRENVSSVATGCPIEATLQLLDGRWKGLILHNLIKEGTLRFNELVRRLPTITHRQLSKQLKELEEAGLVARTVYPVVPPRVDYSLTPLGESMEPVIAAIGRWGQEHLDCGDIDPVAPADLSLGTSARQRTAA